MLSFYDFIHNCSNDLYIVQNLEDTYKYLVSYQGRGVILLNQEGACRYYGFLVLDYIFKSMKKMFSEKILDIYIFVDDYPSFVTASQLNYKNIYFS